MADLTAEGLFEQVYELSPYDHPVDVVGLVDQQFAFMRTREVSPHDAETCRLTMIAALEAGELGTAARWRARALSRFTLLGWREGVASILMGNAFAELGRVNADYPNGKTLDVIEPSEDALAIMDELEPFCAEPGTGISVGDRSPTPALITRFWLEKRGFLLLVLGRYDEARASYARAAVAAEGNARGALRVRAGAALVEYVADDGGREAAVAETEAVRDLASGPGNSDVRRRATDNVAVMRGGGANVHGYEIL